MDVARGGEGAHVWMCQEEVRGMRVDVAGGGEGHVCGCTWRR